MPVGTCKPPSPPNKSMYHVFETTIFYVFIACYIMCEHFTKYKSTTELVI